MKILALCGSLRSRSYCKALLHAAQNLAPADVTIDIYPDLENLPFFNPDLEAHAPSIVKELWQAITEAEALLIASPEYAHGISGTMKNTLDWLVGLPPFYGKPVAVINPSAHSHHADAALREILLTMSADIIAEASIRIAVNGSGLDSNGIQNSPTLAAQIRTVLNAVQIHLLTAKS